MNIIFIYLTIGNKKWIIVFMAWCLIKNKSPYPQIRIRPEFWGSWVPEAVEFPWLHDIVSEINGVSGQ
jgi:hypothetical protein